MVDFNNHIAEETQPNPKSIISSYRSFGYNLSTAIADIVDNSISAECSNIYISYKWNGQNSYISITDDGLGMSLKELIIAMTPGSKDPKDERSANDLGRFGMGLKTASFSQCKSLTVVSKKENHFNYRTWDIDHINKCKKWQLLNYISSEEYCNKLQEFRSGTTVVWEKLDRLIGENISIDNETVKQVFYREMKFVKDHLSLVFHKFIESKKIKIYFNENEIESWNPFLYNLSVKPEMGQPEIFDKGIEVVYYILPHMSRISNEEYQKSGGPLGWFNQQGFYIYRGDRLLVSGDWLGLEKKRDYSKLARISINFPNSSDFDWGLDIKKSTATPPIHFREDLKRIAAIAIKKSANTYNWRGQKAVMSSTGSQKIFKLWYDTTNRDGVKKYKINRDHPLIKLALNKNNSSSIKKILNLIEENIPIELILYNQNEDPSLHELEEKSEIPPDNTISLAVELYKGLVENGVKEQVAKNQVLNSYPFNLYPILVNYLK